VCGGNCAQPRDAPDLATCHATDQAEVLTFWNRSSSWSTTATAKALRRTWERHRRLVQRTQGAAVQLDQWLVERTKQSSAGRRSVRGEATSDVFFVRAFESMRRDVSTGTSAARGPSFYAVDEAASGRLYALVQSLHVSSRGDAVTNEHLLAQPRPEGRAPSTSQPWPER